MPDSIRLSVLHRLREDAGLTLAHVAQRCGLAGSNGRRSVAAWETGTSIPRSRYRLPFALYLLRDLGLVNSPDEFDAIWAILIDEWNWDALDPEERADLWRKAKQEIDPWAEVLSITDKVLINDEEQTNAARDALGVPAPLHAEVDADPTDRQTLEHEPTQATDKAFLWGIPRTYVFATLLIVTFGLLVTQLPDRIGLWRQPLLEATAVTLSTVPATTTVPPTVTPAPTDTHTPTATSTPRPLAFQNQGFELGDLSEWAVVGSDDCEYTIMKDRSRAQDGANYLQLLARSEECISLQRDLWVAPAPGTSVTFALWLRSQTTPVQPASVVIWAGYDPPQGEQIFYDQSQNTVWVDDQEWQCVETTFTVGEQPFNFFRGELYFDAQTDEAIAIDSAVLQAGLASHCPPATPRLINGDFEYDLSIAPVWNAIGEGCTLTQPRDGNLAHRGEGQLIVTPAGINCQSVYQDWQARLQNNTEYTAQVWVRTPDGLPRAGTLTLRAQGENPIHSDQPFVVGERWQCISSTLRVDNAKDFRGLRAEIYFDNRLQNGTYALDAASLFLGAGDCPATLPPVSDPGFETQAKAENLGSFTPIWGANNECALRIENAANLAHTGQGLLMARKEPADKCFSIYTDIPAKIPAKTPIRIAVWAKSSDTRSLNGTLALWALDGPVPNESNRKPFVVDGERWQCFETELTVPEPGLTRLRMEIYIESATQDSYLFDDFQLGIGPDPLCAMVDLSLRSTGITHRTQNYYPGGTISAEAEVRNQGSQATTACADLAAWIADTPNGAPLDNTMVVRSPIPAIAAGAASPPLSVDVKIPLTLDVTRPYYVVWDIEGSGCTDVDPSNNTDFRQITLTPCEQGTLFCDIPTAYWAHTEIEAWHELGITTGCRSNTVPFDNRPFCPEESVRRETFVILVLRHLFGGGYQVDRGYQGLFADVPEDIAYRWALWIEDFYTRGYSLPATNCPALDGKPRFCGEHVMARGELIESLANILAWDLTQVNGDRFTDIKSDTPINRAIEYAARNGFLDTADPHCPSLSTGPQFCPDAPARRDFAAVIMVRAFEQERTRNGD